MQQNLLRVLLGVSLIAGMQDFRAAAADQPQWGQAWSRNMVSGEKRLPDSFDPKTGRNIKWKAALGTETHSTPVIAGGRVYIGTNNGEPRDPKHQGDRGVLMCFEEKTGTFLWQLVVPKRSEDPYFDWPKSGIASPATVEGDRVYIVSNRGEVICLDARGMANGNDGPYRDEGDHMTAPTNSSAPPRPVAGAPINPEPLVPRAAGIRLEPGPLDADILWIFDLVTEAGIWPHDAAHGSILIHGDHLYLNTGTGVDNTHKRIRKTDAPSLVVLDKRTGRYLARDNERIAPNIFHNTWSSPSLGRIKGQDLVFFCGGNGVVYAFETFNPLSSSSSVEPSARTSPPHPALSPDRGEDGQRTGKGKISTLNRVWQFDFDPAAPKENVHKYNTNRRESPSNIYGFPVFLEGRIYVAGGGDIWWGKNEAWLKCIDAIALTRAGGHPLPSESSPRPSDGRGVRGEGSGEWRGAGGEGLIWSYPLEKHVLSTPAIHEGLVFIADCGRTFHCVDAGTGKRFWTHEIQGEVWASPYVADGKVYLGTRSGAYYVFAANKEKNVIATLELGSPISATATAANGALYVATMSQLYAVEQRRLAD